MKSKDLDCRSLLDCQTHLVDCQTINFRSSTHFWGLHLPGAVPAMFFFFITLKPRVE